MGFPPFFDNCPPKSGNKERYEKDDFLRLCILRIKGEQTQGSGRYKYYSRKLVHSISKTNPNNVRLFTRKGGTFLGFHNSESEKGILFLFRVSSTNKDLDFKGVFIFVIRIFCGK